MPKFFVPEEQIEKNEITIMGQDVKHIKNVLRKVIGDEIIVCNKTKEKDYLCEVMEIQKEFIKCNIIRELEENVESKIEITVFQGLPKFDKMELIIQKSVELGVYKIVPVSMKRCVVKLQEKDKEKKQKRWNTISEVAAKQCGRNRVPEINTILNIKDINNLIEEYDVFLVAYENEKDITLKQCLKNIKEEYKNDNIKIGVLIGPEGGIAPEEVQELKDNGAVSMSLGKRILRTETVALNVISIIMYELE